MIWERGLFSPIAPRSESIPEKTRLICMPFCTNSQLRRTGLTPRTVLLIISLGAPLTLHGQQFVIPNSFTSSSNESATLTPPLPAPELPDAPSALQNPQSGQTPTPPKTTDNPDAVSTNGTQ